MTDIFKYQWIKGNLPEILTEETVSSCCLEENALLLGTESGFVYVFSLGGRLLKKYRAHDGRVNGISVDNNGLTIFSCSETGTVVSNSMKSEDEKDILLQLNLPLKAICVEDTLSSKKERSFIVGSSSGQLIYHRHSWFGQKDLELFRGSSSPVTTIAWRGEVVAWADAGQVRVMNITSQAAICYLNSPPNVGPLNPFPCHLFWESEYDLLVGWADSFRHLQLVYTNTTHRVDAEEPNETSGKSADFRARLVADWRADTIICGVSSFDQEHVLVLGYLPPEEELDGNEEVKQDRNVDGPELLLARRSDGHLLSADLLPVNQNQNNISNATFTCPDSFQLLSNYNCYSRRSDYLKWNLNSPHERGGVRGLPPFLYVITPHGAIVSRVRDVNDRITTALQQNNIQLAVELAKSEKHTLRIYQYSDLVKAYFTHLLNEDKAELAAKECQRLIENDPDSVHVWEHWINEFATRKRLTYIAPYIPVENPRLSNTVYEVILGNFLLVNSQALLLAVRKWGMIRPPLFDWKILLDRITSQIESRKKTSISPTDPWLLESKAYLHTLLQQFDKALECYLEIEPTETANHSDSRLEDEPDEYETKRNYQHVFDLIEKKDLFDVIKDKILRLVRLSPKSAENLLVRNVDKVPVHLVVKQLREDTELLHWYLHSLVVHASELYNSTEYAEFHLMQVSLYAHFAPKVPIKSKASSTPSTIHHFDDPDLPLIFTPKKHSYNNTEDTNFLKFLKFSNFVPLEVALRECDRQNPPLYREKIYILAKMGNAKEGLALLLREIGDVYMAIDYVEQYDPELWEEVVNHALAHHAFLGELLDLIGLFNKFNPLTLVKKLPPCMEIPNLRLRLLRLIRHCDFQEFVRGHCQVIQQEDTLSLLTRLNQTQRKGMRITPTMSRCAGCGRPTSMPSAYHPRGPVDSSHTVTMPVPVWGLPSRQTKNAHIMNTSLAACSVVYLSNKVAYHALCFEKVKSVNSVNANTVTNTIS